MARTADQGRCALRPGPDPRPDDPPPARAGDGDGRGIRAPESRQAAPVARGGAVFPDAVEHSPRRAGARRADRGGARRDRLFRRGGRGAARGRSDGQGEGRRPVIDFYYWPTPNGWKVAIMLEESDL